MDRIKLEVLGLSYSQTQAGAYALILTVENSEQRIPIIIGGFEAQAIALQLEGLTPPRPLTHDLFHEFAQKFNIELKEVYIYKLEEGVFYSSLLFYDGKNSVSIDSRTSDAVALALRFKVPVYTTTDIVEKAGIVLNISKDPKTGQVKAEAETSKQKPKSPKSPKKYKDMTIKELENLMQEAINNEDYEKASVIRDEISKKKSS